MAAWPADTVEKAPAGLVDQNRGRPAPFLDGCRNLGDLGLSQVSCREADNFAREYTAMNSRIESEASR